MDRETNALYAEIVGSPGFLAEQMEQIDKVADSEAEVLITGETGVGKELVARAIHQHSALREQRFITVSASNIPERFFEKTGNRAASVEDDDMATGVASAYALTGTLYLNEISDLSASAQAGLLKMIQHITGARRGASTEPAPGLRVLAASAAGIRHAVDTGRFRSDLFFRLNEISIHIKPLRERREDIPVLVDHFIRIYNTKFGKSVARVSDAARGFLQRYNYPGNVRELRNMIQNAVLFTDRDVIWIEDLPVDIVARQPSADAPRELLSLKQLEKKHIAYILDYTGWNVSRAARILGVTRATLYDKIKTFSLARD